LAYLNSASEPYHDRECRNLIKAAEEKFIRLVTSAFSMAEVVDIKVIGELTGVNEQKLPVVTVWQKRQIDYKFYFITLKPY
jgi:hypothetical protein